MDLLTIVVLLTIMVVSYFAGGYITYSQLRHAGRLLDRNGNVMK